MFTSRPVLATGEDKGLPPSSLSGTCGHLLAPVKAESCSPPGSPREAVPDGEPPRTSFATTMAHNMMPSPIKNVVIEPGYRRRYSRQVTRDVLPIALVYFFIPVVAQAALNSVATNK